MIKKIAIMVRMLNSGGVERTMENLVSALVSQGYKVDLIIQGTKGSYDIKALKVNRIFNLSDLYPEMAVVLFESKEKIYASVKKGKIKNAIKILKMSVNARKYLASTRKFFEYMSNNMEQLENEYDLAIDFHGYGDFSTYFVANNVKAKKKVTWIHDEMQDWSLPLRQYYSLYDQIFCVSKTCKDVFIGHFPDMCNKVQVFYNLLPIEKIVSLSKEEVTDLSDQNKTVLLTVGRLENQKGYDILLDVAERLKTITNDYVWYCIGEGQLQDSILYEISNRGLEEHVKLLGFRSNPYKYMRYCDIYVQPSRHEGYCTTISEAKIIGCPIVFTDVSGAREQLENGFNGFITAVSSDQVFIAVKKLVENKNIRSDFSERLLTEKNSNQTEILKIESLLQ